MKMALFAALLPVRATLKMKQLFLLRHAKSSWAEPNVKDFDRPLNKRGKENAPKMAALLHKNYGTPDAIVVSPSLRTMSTAEFHAKEFGLKMNDLIKDERIYESPGMRLLQVLSELPEEANSALLIGHNPGLSHLVLYLSGEALDMPTSGLAVLELHVDSWFALGNGVATLKGYHFPKKDFA